LLIHCRPLGLLLAQAVRLAHALVKVLPAAVVADILAAPIAQEDFLAHYFAIKFIVAIHTDDIVTVFHIAAAPAAH
jgi:hypothetical protein